MEELKSPILFEVQSIDRFSAYGIISNYDNKEAESLILYKSAFLNFSSIKSGQTIKLYFDQKRQSYTEFSVLFDIESIKQNYKLNEIICVKIIKFMKDFLIFERSDQYGFGKIFYNDIPHINEQTVNDKFTLKDGKVIEFPVEKFGYKIGDAVDVVLNEQTKFSVYSLNQLVFRDTVKSSGFYKMKIVRIEEFKLSIDADFYNVIFYTDTNLKIDIKSDNKILLEKNFLLWANEIAMRKYIEFEIYYNYDFNDFKLYMAHNLSNSNDYHTSQLGYNSSGVFYYIETEKGYIELNKKNMTYIESLFLKAISTNMHSIFYSASSDYSDYVNMRKFNDSELNAMQKKEFIDAKTLSYIDTNLDKRIFLIDLGSGILGFLEQGDYSYDGSFPDINERIEKVRVKGFLSKRFILLERKCFLPDPKIEYFKNIMTGEKVSVKIKEVHSEYIIVKFKNFELSIEKNKLSPLKHFNTEEFYKKDAVCDLYLDSKDPVVSLLGYVPSEITAKLKSIKIGTEISAVIYKILATKFIVRIDKNHIEATVSYGELSYLDHESKIPLFEKGKKMQFKVTNIENTHSAENYAIFLSRKRLSNPLFEFEKFYKTGDRAEGIYFCKNDSGYYFNLFHKGQPIAEMTGFLPKNDVDDYPDYKKFESEIINKRLEFLITAFPKEELGKYKEKFNPVNNNFYVKLSRRDVLYQKALEELLSDNASSYGLCLQSSDICKSDYSDIFSDEKFYFLKTVKNRKIVFSLRPSRILPGFAKCDHLISEFSKSLNTILDDQEILKYYSNVIERTTEGFILRNFDLDFYNSSDHTFEISFTNQLLKNFEKDGNEIEITAKKDIEGNYFGYLCDNELVKIRVNLQGKFFAEGKKYKCRISNYSSESDCFSAVINSLGKENIGDLYSVKIIRENNARIYTLKCLDSIEGTVISSETDFFSGEEFYAVLESVEGKNYRFGYEPIGNDLRGNFERYSIKDLLKFASDKRNYSIYKKDLFSGLFRTLKDKTALAGINSGLPLEKFIDLIENGNIIENYALKKDPLGLGAFGVVYEGLDMAANRRVIMKKFTALKDDENKKRFELEADILSKNDFNGVMKVYDYYREDLKYIGEFAGGKNFRTFVDENRNLSYSSKNQVFIPLLTRFCNIMSDISFEGITHCDIKPENIVFDEKSDRITLIDFGSIQYMVMKGGFGTIYYASPEQCEIFPNPHLHNSDEHDFGTETDVYAFGVILYEIFTGKLPYGKDLEESSILLAHKYGQKHKDCEYSFKFPSEINPDIEPEMEKLILDCMKTDKTDRISDFDEIKERLEALYVLFQKQL